MALNSLPPSAPALASRRSPILGEDESYSIARKALLAEEIDLRRRMRQVAEIRRTLPAGPLLKAYSFKAPDGEVKSLDQLFGDHDTLMIYACDFGKLGLSPRCYHFLAALQGNIDALRTRTEFAVVSDASCAEMNNFAEHHRWRSMNSFEIADPQFVSDLHIKGRFDHFIGTLIVCRKSADGIRLFWKSEMSEDMADQNETPIDMFEFGSIWTLLDLTPDGRSPADHQPRDPYRIPWDNGAGNDPSSGRWPRPVYGIA